MLQASRDQAVDRPFVAGVGEAGTIATACGEGRDWIAPELEKLGRLRHRVATSHEGKGARKITEYLLSNAQINYLITHCGLPSRWRGWD